MNAIHLFVDFDGVLLPIARPGAIVDVTRLGDIAAHDWRLVGKLAATVQPFPRVQLVVSSTWRHFLSMEEICELLAPMRVIGTTRKSMGSRYDEIHGWMYKRPNPWIAIDDDDYDWPDQMRHHLLYCDPHVGLDDPAKLVDLEVRLRELCDG